MNHSGLSISSSRGTVPSIPPAYIRFHPCAKHKAPYKHRGFKGTQYGIRT